VNERDDDISKSKHVDRMSNGQGSMNVPEGKGGREGEREREKRRENSRQKKQ
jgi:hypothetical protein